MKISIRTKIMGALLLIAVITCTVLALYSNQVITGVRDSALVYGDRLGKQLTGDSRNILYHHTLDQLKTSAVNYTAVAGFQLREISFFLQRTTKDFTDRLNEGNYAKQQATISRSRKLNADSVCYLISTNQDVVITQSFLVNLAEPIRLIREMKNFAPVIRHVMVLLNGRGVFIYPWSAPVGRQFAINGIPFQISSFAILPPGIQQHLLSPRFSKKEVQDLWSEPYLSPLSTKEDPLVACVTPISLHQGKITGTMVVELQLSKLFRYIISPLPESGGIPFLMDAHGKCVVGRVPEKYSREQLQQGVKPLLEKFRQKKAGTHLLTIGKEEFLAAYAPIQCCDWYLVLVQPKQTALHCVTQMEKMLSEEQAFAANSFHISLRKLLPSGLFIFLVLILLILVLGGILSHHLTKPINVLIEQAKLIGDGHFFRRIRLNTGDELELLAATFNKMASNLTNYIHNLNEAVRERQRVDSELQAAAQIQQAMLPVHFPERQDLELFAVMKPAREIGGDLYDFVFIDPEHLFFAVGDVSGKGIPAALFMATAKTLMRENAVSGHSPAEILLKTNNTLAASNKNCMFITVFCGILNCMTGEVLVCSAGHNQPMLVTASESRYISLPAGFPLGPMYWIREEVPFREIRFQLQPGDRLLLYTDGITEAMNDQQEPFGKERLQKAAGEMAQADSLEVAAEQLIKKVAEHTGVEPQSDDLTLMLLQYKGK